MAEPIGTMAVPLMSHQIILKAFVSLPLPLNATGTCAFCNAAKESEPKDHGGRCFWRHAVTWVDAINKESTFSCGHSIINGDTEYADGWAKHSCRHCLGVRRQATGQKSGPPLMATNESLSPGSARWSDIPHRGQWTGVID